LLRGATIVARMIDFFNRRIWVQSLCSPLRPFWSDQKKIPPQYFTSCIIDVYLYKNVSLTHYMIPRKIAKFVQVTTGGAKKRTACSVTNGNNRNAFKPCTLKKTFGGFIQLMVCSVICIMQMTLKHFQNILATACLFYFCSTCADNMSLCLQIVSNLGVSPFNYFKK